MRLVRKQQDNDLIQSEGTSNGKKKKTFKKLSEAEVQDLMTDQTNEKNRTEPTQVLGNGSESGETTGLQLIPECFRQEGWSNFRLQHKYQGCNVYSHKMTMDNTAVKSVCKSRVLNIQRKNFPFFLSYFFLLHLYEKLMSADPSAVIISIYINQNHHAVFSKLTH